jgi:predicted RNA-binding Zn ribbon-like protein
MDMGASEREWVWYGGRVSLDFVNTRRDREADPVEYLRRPGDLEAWLEAAGVAAAPARADAGAFADALALREAIDAVVLATVSGTAPPGQALSDLNDWLSLMPGPSPLLRRSGDLVTFDTGPRDQGVRAVLAPIALDAAQLVGSDLRSRLRICPGTRCGGRFLDRSAGGRRRWCSMAVCGNRSKASSHRHATAQSLSRPAG